MDLYKDTLKFQKLSIKYRELKSKKKGVEAEKVEAEIKLLVNGVVDRLRLIFNLKMERTVSAISERYGIPIIAMSIPKLMNGDRDYATLDIHNKKMVQGLNLLLDYSGSMWFEGCQSIDGKDLQRIYGQNFLALCIAGVVTRMNKDVVVHISGFCRRAINVMDIRNNLEFNTKSWDGLLIHYEWGSGVNVNKKLMPSALKSCDDGWFNNEYIKESLDQVITVFKKHKDIKSFINVFMTDGGLSRIGETEQDREQFLNRALLDMQKISKNVSNSFIFIKQQAGGIKDLCKKYNVDFTTIENKNELEKAFLHIVSMTSKVKK